MLPTEALISQCYQVMCCKDRVVRLPCSLYATCNIPYLHSHNSVFLLHCGQNARNTIFKTLSFLSQGSSSLYFYDAMISNLANTILDNTIVGLAPNRRYKMCSNRMQFSSLLNNKRGKCENLYIKYTQTLLNLRNS